MHVYLCLFVCLTSAFLQKFVLESCSLKTISLLVSLPLFIVLMTTVHEELGGGKNGGCVDVVAQQTLSK